MSSSEDEFDPEKYTTLAGPWPVVDSISVAVRQYEGNAPKIRIERTKKNGDVRPFRGGFTAEQATALIPVLKTAAEALAKIGA